MSHKFVVKVTADSYAVTGLCMGTTVSIERNHAMLASEQAIDAALAAVDSHLILENYTLQAEGANHGPDAGEWGVYWVIVTVECA